MTSVQTPRGAFESREVREMSQLVPSSSSCTSCATGLLVRIPRVSNPRTFAREVEASRAGILSVDNAVVPDYLHPAEKGHVRTEVTLHLDEDDGCAVLSSLAFLATCVRADDREAYLRGQTLIDWERSAAKSEGGFTTAAWEWEP